MKMSRVERRKKVGVCVWVPFRLTGIDDFRAVWYGQQWANIAEVKEEVR